MENVLAEKITKKALVNIFLSENSQTSEPAKLVIIEVINGVKQSRVMSDPDISFYVSKREFVEKHAKEQLVFLPVEELELFTCSYQQMFGHMYKLLDRDPSITRRATYQKVFKTAYARRNNYEFKKMHSHPMFHGSDIDIVDFHINKWYEDAIADGTLDTFYSLTKAYFDIEVDGYKLGTFPDENLAPRPVNAITYFFKSTGKLWIGLTSSSAYYNDAMEDLVKVKDEIAQDFFNKYSDDKDLTLSEFGTLKEVVVEFFDQNGELPLITRFLHIVNEIDRPDVISAFNIKFDYNTIFNRLKNNYNVQPASLFCPQDFQYIRNTFYYEDKRAKDITEKKDYIFVASYTLWQDQMLNFAKLRKSDKRDSWSLDETARVEIGARKIDLAPYSITDVYYRNPRLFIDYSATDTFHLSRIEDNTGDIDILYTLMFITRTRFDKVLTKTVSLRNMAALFFAKQGIIISNNKNTNKLKREDKIKIKFRGAFVADPNLMAPVGIMINGRRLRNIFKLVFDLDLRSLYPSIILSTNIDIETLLFYIEIWRSGFTEIVKDENNKPHEVNINFGPEFMDALTSKDWGAIFENWFGMPSTEKIILEFEDRIKPK